MKKLTSTVFYRRLMVLLHFHVLVLTGCAATPTPHFYMLTSMQQAVGMGTMSTDRERFHIGIGPVKFPEYLERSQIVTRTSGTEIYLSDRHRWGESLQENFTRVLAENLSVLLEADEIIVFPSSYWSEIDYQIVVNVSRFDAEESGDVILAADWSVHERDKAKLLIREKSEFKLATSSPVSYAEIVEKLSITISHLSREMADTVNGIEGLKSMSH